MKKIETYWCEDRPTLEDIKTAYNRVQSEDVVVKIEWFIRYNGTHSRIITKDELSKYPTYEEYFNNCIPQCYGV